MLLQMGSGVVASRELVLYFDVRIFNPFTTSNKHVSLAVIYRRHEEDKKHQYAQRVHDMDHSSFTPLVFTSGGMGKCTTFYQRIALMLSENRQIPYSVAMYLLHCRFSFE